MSSCERSFELLREHALREGRIAPAQTDTLRQLYETDPDATAAFLDTSPVRLDLAGAAALRREDEVADLLAQMFGEKP